MPYSRFTPEDLILRDHLAVDRTVLANERTLLAYIRTAIMLLISGVTLLKFFPNQAVMQILGCLLLPGALAISFLGAIRYRTMHHRIGQIGVPSVKPPSDAYKTKE
ncbi:MAG: DUF202 domain-containing protein [Armatimonadota bacterium]|nr:DUF202 domain-containing protein [Armatimonadota bacterium]